MSWSLRANSSPWRSPVKAATRMRCGSSFSHFATVGAARLVAQQQHLRTEEGRYWTGWQYVAAVHWPDECSSWTAASFQHIYLRQMM